MIAYILYIHFLRQFIHLLHVMAVNVSMCTLTEPIKLLLILLKQLYYIGTEGFKNYSRDRPFNFSAGGRGVLWFFPRDKKNSNAKLNWEYLVSSFFLHVQVQVEAHLVIKTIYVQSNLDFQKEYFIYLC
jgi:hypothetical protein